ncbi:fibronectin type III domain-containing protein [Treponema sp.]|uniref:fibronectin type III domain-containing protein n=1 Tax=Treponema sp. TaxID=166 RepID=UPI0025DEB8FC|nr:fibronectin type III domain-containing protein [Treponema sp.]MCR5217999.1 fibronectin type III domain-containing protein [Treponema sp.]
MKILNRIMAGLIMTALFCALSCTEEYSSAVYENNYNIAPSDVFNLTQSQVKDVVTLTWQLPEDNDIEYISISANPAHGNLETEKIISKATSFDVYGLKTGRSYDFTVKVINKKGTYSSGAVLSYRPNINSDLIDYLYDKEALDFGYCSTETEKTFAYTSIYDDSLDLSSAVIEYVCGAENAFTFNESSLSQIAQGETSNITVTYTPSEEASWDEADLVLCQDPEVRIRLIASSFEQPSDIQSSHLRLWLRPDMISSSDIDSYGNVQSLPDYSGNGFDAEEFDTMPPAYVSSIESMNNLPGVFFDGIKRLRASGEIVKSSNGTTTFIVTQQTSASNGDYNFLICTNGYSTSYPIMSNRRLYFDEDKGYSTTQRWGVAVNGSGMSGVRYMFDDSEEEDNIVKTCDFTKPDVVCSLLNLEETDANIFAYLNGTKQLLSYTHSLNTSTYDCSESGANYKYNNGCAYGKPWSDGKGHLYKTLWNESDETLTDDSDKQLYYQLNPSEHPTRPYDYALRWYYLRNVLKRTAQSDMTAYYSNKVTYKSATMGTIANVYLGATLTNTGTNLHNYIGDVIIYDTALTDEEIASVSTYLKLRYGITD